jgi:hypothetical protein
MGQIRHGLVNSQEEVLVFPITDRSRSSDRLAYKTGGQYHDSLNSRLPQTRHLCAVSTVLAMNAFPVSCILLNLIPILTEHLEWHSSLLLGIRR